MTFLMSIKNPLTYTLVDNFYSLFQRVKIRIDIMNEIKNFVFVHLRLKKIDCYVISLPDQIVRRV